MAKMKTLTVKGVTFDIEDDGAVRYDAAQELTDEQKAQARENIGAEGVGLRSSLSALLIPILEAGLYESNQSGNIMALKALLNPSAIVPATGITISKDSLRFSDNVPQTLTAEVTPENATDILYWVSSNANVARVENGIVTPVADGECTITAKAGEASASCSIKVHFGVVYLSDNVDIYIGDASCKEGANPYHYPYTKSRACINPFALPITAGKTYKVSVSNSPDFIYCVTVGSWPGSMDFSYIGDVTKQWLDATLGNVVETGWKYSGEYTYTADGNANIMNVKFGKTAGGDFTTEEIAALKELFVWTEE